MLLQGAALALNLAVCFLSSGTKEENKAPRGISVLRPPESLRRVCVPTQLPSAETEASTFRCWSAIQGNKQ